jgi:hypothetical protein
MTSLPFRETSRRAITRQQVSRRTAYSLNGQRSTGTEILLDGVENISVFTDGVGIVVPVDTVQEFSVTTSNFLPQYGRASGGIVNVTTRTGTNNFHGSAWEFNRLSAYTANTETNGSLPSFLESSRSPHSRSTRFQASPYRLHRQTPRLQFVLLK